jgi:hypothetical protein
MLRSRLSEVREVFDESTSDNLLSLISLTVFSENEMKQQVYYV